MTKNIAVFCGSNNGKNSSFGDKAIELGEAFAKNNIQLIYGGANVGIMKKIAESVIENNGKVIGVITNFLAKKHLTQKGLNQLITVETMHERKAKMSDLADAFFILPGGCGTLEEFFEVFTSAQLGFHNKPIVIFNIDGFFDSLKALFEQMINEKLMLAQHVDMLLFTDSIKEAFTYIKLYKAPLMEKWIDDIKKESKL